MFIGLIANSNGPHATISWQRRHDLLLEDRFAANAIDRLKVILPVAKTTTFINQPKYSPFWRTAARR